MAQVGDGDGSSGLADAAGGGADRPPGRTPAQDQHLGVTGRIVHHQIWDVRHDAVHLGLPQPHHQVVVVGGIADLAAAIGFLEASDAVLQPGRPGQGERPGEPLVTGIRQERAVRPVRFGREPGVDRLDRRQVGDQPRLGPVGQVAVRQHDDRRPVDQRDTDGLDGGREAVGRRLRGQHRHRGLAVASVKRLRQVGLLGLGGHTRGRPGPLDVANHQRLLEHHRQRDGLRFQGQSRPRG